MLNDKPTNSIESSTETKDVNKLLKELKGVKKLKSLDIDNSSGFVCDVTTGICGPVTQQKEEGKK
ncbi:hypothetical protein [Bacillus sp. REN16]|uniref:hypothetical protein n=1 Tax=Bacillus sp. REN16 TaxID=2887296 RepID=UPI001E5105DC|nr:hypothetical protein [Bacillus sp. REN16]MCC3357412.1 hypothetical protein [Bacillus sp. REN16]